jgi:hypothetical protein
VPGLLSLNNLHLLILRLKKVFLHLTFILV